MKVSNPSILAFDSQKYTLIVYILSILSYALQEATNQQLLDEPYNSIAHLTVLVLANFLGKLKFQPELHTPDLFQYAQPQSLFNKPTTPPNELDWVAVARSYVGLKENTSKTEHNPTILKWLSNLNAWWRNDETPWCGVFLAECLKQSGFTRGTFNSRKNSSGVIQPNTYPYNWYGALDWLVEGGYKLPAPCYGCVAIKARKGGGHVCFVVGKTKQGKLVCLGGNQSNMVSYALYDEDDFKEFRWYGRTPQPSKQRFNLPLVLNVTATKVTEA